MRIEFLWVVQVASALHEPIQEEVGGLAGDVQNWAMLIENFILQLASDGIKRDYTQSLFDTAQYTEESKNGSKVVEQVAKSLGEYFSKKQKAAKRLADELVKLYRTFKNSKKHVNYTNLEQLSFDVYRDCDIPKRLPSDLKLNPYFKQPTSSNYSIVKISDEVPRDATDIIDTVVWSRGLEEIFKENAKQDPLIRWQYFGSQVGLARIYPGREWDTNFAGFYNDYDPRVRPWYIGATSGPRDVVIVIDCSLSMKGTKFSIAQAVAKTVINTLERRDYVNVICARASHWDEVSKWHFYKTEVLSCQQDRLVQATVAHRKDLIEKVYMLKAGGTSELERGIEVAYQLLNGKTRTGCQSIIVFVTDGKDTDGEKVRCGPGYYTRSGYVPGPICKYNWTKVWNTAEFMHNQHMPKTRVFSYLTVDDGEIMPGYLACQHGGSFKKLMTGENLITQMSNYFDFLVQNSRNKESLWTSPYLDNWGLGLMVTLAYPCIDDDGKIIGVVGIDSTLEEIDNFLSHHQWGSVYSFLMNRDGETIFHPRLKPSTNLVDDPIFIPIEQLEPAEFAKIATAMKRGEHGHATIEKARKGLGKNEFEAATYYYSSVNDSDYSIAFSLTKADQKFRRAIEPRDKGTYDKSYFNLLIEYNSSIALKNLPGVFEYLDVRYNESKYPGLRVSHLHSSIFLAPKCHCNPNAYFYDDDLAQKTVDAHHWINSITNDYGCENQSSKYEKGIRADVLISQDVEKLWRDRKFYFIDDVKWTYVGMRSGVFRTYPAHRSRRLYDPTKRPWYKRASSTPSKTSISTAYMDAAGVGKIITVSQAVFEGMDNQMTEATCRNKSKNGPWPGGCPCKGDHECIIGACYVSEAPGENPMSPRCATERVEAVTSLDILYNRFHDIIMRKMEASDKKKSCGMSYNCPDGTYGCQTRCYLFDNAANLITDPDFISANNLDVKKYKGVTMGRKEGEVMRDLIYKQGFFKRTEKVDFQDVCSISPYAPKVTLEGIPKNPEELDDYYKNKGPIPKFNNEFGCITDVVGYSANADALGPSGMITGNVSGPCMSGFYYVVDLPKTNLFLLVIEDWHHYKTSFFYNFNCKIAQSIVNSGAYRIINGTCAHWDTSTTTLADQGKCPALINVDIPCTYTAADAVQPSCLLPLLSFVTVKWCTGY